MPPLRQRLAPPPDKREDMLQNLCVLDPASTGTAESSGGGERDTTPIHMGR